MNKLTYAFISVFLGLTLWALNAMAAAPNEMASVSVLAEPRLTVALARIASEFTHENRITVSVSFGASTEQEKRIEDGEAADLFITANPQLIENLKIKGLVDVYSIGVIASGKEGHFTAAVVASENMTAARSFLAFLKSGLARTIFKNNGLSVP